MNDIEKLKKQGCSGFVTVEKLTNDLDIVPRSSGVYYILRTSTSVPSFLKVGSGGRYKDKNPNVEIAKLENNWVEGTQILYIGKATSLYKRLKQYMEFGQGEPVGHWGGRFIWQLEDAKDLIVCWNTCPTAEVAGTTESSLIMKFKKEHNGMRPFANLRD